MKTAKVSAKSPCVRLFFFYPFEYHMDLCKELCLSSQLVGQPSCAIETLTLDITCKLFNQVFFIPVMLIDTINCNHCVPLRLTFTLPGGHKVRVEQNLLASFSPTLSS